MRRCIGMRWVLTGLLAARNSMAAGHGPPPEDLIGIGTLGRK